MYGCWKVIARVERENRPHDAGGRVANPAHAYPGDMLSAQSRAPNRNSKTMHDAS